MRSRHIEEVAPALGRAGRWVGGCDDVTRDEKGVDSLGPDRVEQPAEEEAMLILALDPVGNVAAHAGDVSVLSYRSDEARDLADQIERHRQQGE